MSTPLTQLVVAVPTLNNMRTIERTIQSVQGLAGRVVVMDSGSDDGTDTWCEEQCCEVLRRDWSGMVDQRRALHEACGDAAWILHLDSDESLDEELQGSIREVVTSDEQKIDGWSFNRKLWFAGGWLHHVCQPEWRLRLVRGDRATIGGAGVDGAGGHDRLEVPGSVARLAGTCRHDSWENLEDLINRANAYGRRAAQSGQRGGSLVRMVGSPIAVMIKQLVLRGGVMDGRRGLLVASGLAATTFVKHFHIFAARVERSRHVG